MLSRGRGVALSRLSPTVVLRQVTTPSHEPQNSASTRFGILGGGIAGLALAGILSKQMPQATVTVLERARADRDQGYGLDLDNHGHEALSLAGVYDRYWEFSRPHSDVAQITDLQGTLLFAKFMPRPFRRSNFQPEPESNREVMRQVILDALSRRDNATVLHEAEAKALREVSSPDGPTIQVLDRNDEIMGEFDLVVDSCGVHSPFRNLRVDDLEGKHFEGRSLMHGLINDPDSRAPKELLALLGEGSLFTIGQGYFFCLQRFGAAPEDKRTAFFYTVRHDEPGGVARAMGLKQAASREQGILRDEEPLRKVKEWIHADMGGHFHPMFHAAVDCLDRVTVRDQYTHGQGTKLKQDLSMPLVCIGDSLRDIGLGGGGNLALEDAVVLAKALMHPGTINADGKPDLTPLRDAEQKQLDKKLKFDDARRKARGEMEVRRPGESANLSLKQLLSLVSPMAGALAPVVSAISTGLFRWELNRYGIVGTPPPKK